MRMDKIQYSIYNLWQKLNAVITTSAHLAENIQVHLAFLRRSHDPVSQLYGIHFVFQISCTNGCFKASAFKNIQKLHP